MKRYLVAFALIAPLAAMPAAFAASSALGDLSAFEKIASDTLVLVQRDDLKGAASRITDFEMAWDNAEPSL